jgi:hypothetical protein
MKIVFKEFQGEEYQNYRFPYCVYTIQEAKDTLFLIYSQGFLPYSNDFTITYPIYYLARSIKIDLTEEPLFNYKQNTVFNHFKDIFPEEQLTISLIPKEALVGSISFTAWCIKHAKNGFLSTERLQYILSRPYLKEVLMISCKERILAYLLLVHQPPQFAHVWFSFYDTDIKENNFGKWVLLQTIHWCKKNDYAHFFIGTCYAHPALYKLTLSPRTSYFDGEKWNQDISGLKKRLIEDNNKDK